MLAVFLTDVGETGPMSFKHLLRMNTNIHRLSTWHIAELYAFYRGREEVHQCHTAIIAVDH